MIKKIEDSRVQMYFQGPAKRIWETEGGRHRSISSYPAIEDAVKGSAMLISGTSWQSSLEHEARRQAKCRGIFSVALIDHWVNYLERFERDGQRIWPDEFWVTDDFALEMAQNIFQGECVRQVPNYYLEDQLERIKLSEKTGSNTLLYLTEPAEADWGRDLPGEFQALNYFISRIECFKNPVPLSIRLRPHPSEPKSKYDEWISQNNVLDIAVDARPSLADSLSSAQFVVGCQTNAMIVALAAGKKVFCSLPPWAPPCKLPHPGIMRL